MMDWVSGKLLKMDRISENIIISSPFVLTVDNKTYQNVIANLYDQFIILENKKSTFKIFINFQFQVNFELIRYKDQKGQLGTPRSIKFLYHENWIQLKNSSIPKDMDVWIENLTQKLNQKGFHDYYQAIKKIGKGGFASVYLVKKKYQNQQIAVKAFSKQIILAQSKGSESLEKQIKIMRSLDHKNLLKLYQVFETPNSYYLCIQLLSGGSLTDRIRKKQKFSSLSIKNIMKNLLEGLEHMHQQNLMHRDLKPDNILFQDYQTDQCVIADFGLSQNSKSTQYLHSRCGTPGYVAPQIANLKNPNQKYTVACDMFSLGIILHILLLRKAPFEGKQYNDVLIKNRNCQIDFNQSQYSRLPDSWLDLLKRMLHKNPKKRITASQALQHKFFQQQVVFKQFIQKRRKQSMQKMRTSSGQKNIELKSCQSNILLSGNRERKNNINLLEDSCIKFKMQESILTGKISQSKQNIGQIDSPLIIKKSSKNQTQSRFRSRA